MSWSGLLKFLTGFTIAIALLFLAGVGATRYLITRLSMPPQKPIFPNDAPGAPATIDPAAANAASQPPASQPPASTPSPSPVNEPGAYEARVVEPIGLVLRRGPSRSTDRIGGLDYNERVVVLETSTDGEWVRVRLANSDIEGWVKSGNTERIE